MDLIKREQDEDQRPFLSKVDEDDISLSEDSSVKTTSVLKRYSRLILEILMAFTIVLVFFHPFLDRKTGRPSPVPTCTFLTYSKYVNGILLLT